MSNTRAYFHDRLVLLFLTINSFLVVLISLTVLLRLDGQSIGYIVQYRSNLGLDGFKVGEASDMFSFVIFAVLVFAFQSVMSMRVYRIRKLIAHVTVVLTALILVFCLIVSNALLVLR